jgi:molybdopterin adenylyltransferase
MVVEARKLVDQNTENNLVLDAAMIDALQTFSYADAAHHVYGINYEQWKSRYQKKATDEQMQKYNASQSIHAKHDDELMKPRMSQLLNPEKVSTSIVKDTPSSLSAAAAAAVSLNLRSNVCCDDPDDVVNATTTATTTNTGGEATAAIPVTNEKDTAIKQSRQVGPFIPPSISLLELEKTCGPILRVAVLTVSDRASRNEYSSGDLSGPAVIQSLEQWWDKHMSCQASSVSSMSTVKLHGFMPVIVPDETEAIQNAIRTWCDTTITTEPPHIIFTTGGTGFAVRDITPEATREIVDIECPGLMSFITMECARVQPLSCLSRGTAGIVLSSQTMVVNLPGNPKGIDEVIPIVAPLLLHALIDIHLL